MSRVSVLLITGCSYSIGLQVNSLDCGSDLPRGARLSRLDRVAILQSWFKLVLHLHPLTASFTHSSSPVRVYKCQHLQHDDPSNQQHPGWKNSSVHAVYSLQPHKSHRRARYSPSPSSPNRGRHSGVRRWVRLT